MIILITLQRYTFLVNKQKKKKRYVNAFPWYYYFFCITHQYLNIFSHFHIVIISYSHKFPSSMPRLHHHHASHFISFPCLSFSCLSFPPPHLPHCHCSPRFFRGALSLSSHTNAKQPRCLNDSEAVLRCVRGSNSWPPAWQAGILTNWTNTPMELCLWSGVYEARTRDLQRDRLAF